MFGKLIRLLNGKFIILNYFIIILKNKKKLYYNVRKIFLFYNLFDL